MESGARNVDNILTNTLLPEVSRLLLERIAEGVKPAGIRVGIGGDGTFEYTTGQEPQPESRTMAPALSL